MISARDLDDPTISLRMRGWDVEMVITGTKLGSPQPERVRRLGGSAMDEMTFEPHERVEQGEFLFAKIPEGGSANSTWRFLLDGCAVVVMAGGTDDLNVKSLESVSMRIEFGPGKRIWAR